MRIKSQLLLLLAVGCVFAFSSQAQAQCLSCKHGAAMNTTHSSQSTPAAVSPYPSAAGCGCSNCEGLDPTVPVEMPRQPIQPAYDSPMGCLNVPSIFTPPKSYLPPVGKAVGRPWFGRWNGF